MTEEKDSKNPGNPEARSRRSEKQEERFRSIREKSKNRNDSDESDAEEDGPVWDEERITAQAEMFANRVKKKRQHLWKWARRTNVSCFRIYDRDIPEIPFQIDEYERHLVVSQLLRFRKFDESQMKIWTERMVDAAARALGIEASKVFLKDRVPQKSHSQYEKLGTESRIITANEGQLQFLVNLSDYLDVGLFLDHRDTRATLRELSLGTRVLNLFSYTGSFSVYAASGGAQSTTSVDMSNNYCQWAQKNLENNGFFGKSHQVICEDVLAWVPAALSKGDRYDIIVLDPPTFSNGKKMSGVFDVQRDHAGLINQLLRLLTRNGIIIFSTNFKKFRLEKERIASSYVDDISNKTTPEDFAGKKPHRCYVIKKDR